MSDNEEGAAERRILWQQLGQLRPKIDDMAAGNFENSQLERDLIALLARVIQTELDFQAEQR